MIDDILVLNSGSSSLKFSLFHAKEPLQRSFYGAVDGIGGRGRFQVFDADGMALRDEAMDMDGTLDHGHALSSVMAWLDARPRSRPLGAVGHRVVHGGGFTGPVLVDQAAFTALEALAPLAPLHQGHNLAAIQALAARRPSLPQVACFDTTFHRTQDPVVQSFAIPRALTDEGVRRYGFHGLSFEYVAGEMPRLADGGPLRKVVVAHLGSGASLCAMHDGRSVDATTGFSALDGLPMATRCGSLDPGVVLYLASQRGMSIDAITDLLYRRSGLLGISGISNDMRILLDSVADEARQAVEMFVYRVARELGAMVAALGGIDALVFTGGIGEHAAPVREAVCDRARWLGIALDHEANRHGATRISQDESKVKVFVVPTHEGTVIARHVLRLVGGSDAERRVPVTG